MVKIRLQGTSNELKRMKRALCRNKNLDVINVSGLFENKGTSKYYRQYMDIRFVNSNTSVSE